MAFGIRHSIPDRRSARRYQVDVTLEFRIVRGGEVIRTGRGLTSNISESGLLFQCEEPLAPGLDIELSINWLGHESLQVRAAGRTVRTEDGHCAVTILHYDFHNVARNTESNDPLRRQDHE